MGDRKSYSVSCNFNNRREREMARHKTGYCKSPKSVVGTCIKIQKIMEILSGANGVTITLVTLPPVGLQSKLYTMCNIGDDM